MLDEKISVVASVDPKTNYYLKLIQKTIKKINKKIEKMSQIIKLDETEEVNHIKLKEKLEDLLLVELDLFIEKLRSP